MAESLTPNIIKRADVTNNASKGKKFTLAQQKLPSKNNTETAPKILNTKSIDIVLNWQSTSGI